MKKELLENALHQPINITLIDGKNYYGYLVKDRYRKNYYCILPLNLSIGPITFCSGYVKEYIFYSNKKKVR